MASPILIDETVAAHVAGRTPSTIRRWAAEGRIRRHGHGRGHVRYPYWDIPQAIRDDDGEIVHIPDPPPLPHNRTTAAA